jgi:hypothetical protein
MTPIEQLERHLNVIQAMSRMLSTQLWESENAQLAAMADAIYTAETEARHIIDNNLRKEG